MNTVHFDALKRPVVFGTIIAVIVLAAAWWFAWMTPEGHKLATLDTQKTTLQSQQSLLQTELTSLEQEAKVVHRELPFLKSFQVSIPATPDAGVLVDQLYALSRSTATVMTSVTDNTIVAPTGPGGAASTATGYSDVPVSISLTGSHDGVLAFIQGLYSLPRLVTIQSISFTGPGNLNTASKSAPYGASITATAYTTFVQSTTNA